MTTIAVAWLSVGLAAGFVAWTDDDIWAIVEDHKVAAVVTLAAFVIVWPIMFARRAIATVRRRR